MPPDAALMVEHMPWTRFAESAARVKIPPPRKYRCPPDNGISRYLCDQIGAGRTMSHNQSLSYLVKGLLGNRTVRHICVEQELCQKFSCRARCTHMSDWHITQLQSNVTANFLLCVIEILFLSLWHECVVYFFTLLTTNTLWPWSTQNIACNSWQHG